MYFLLKKLVIPAENPAKENPKIKCIINTINMYLFGSLKNILLYSPSGAPLERNIDTDKISFLATNNKII